MLERLPDPLERVPRLAIANSTAGCRQRLSEAMYAWLLRRRLVIEPSTNGARIHESSHHSAHV